MVARVSMLFGLLSLVSVGSASSAYNSTNLQDRFKNYDKNGKERKLWLDHLSRAKSSCLCEQDVEFLEYKYDWFPTDKKMRGSYLSYLVSQCG